MSSYVFKHTNKVGLIGEALVTKFLKSKHFIINENDGKKSKSKYDIKATRMGTNSFVSTFEVKTDVYNCLTGNIAFEISESGQPSGICVTESDYWVIVFPHKFELWMAKVDDVINFLKKHKDKKRLGGVSGQSCMILIPENEKELDNIFIKEDIMLTQIDIKKLIFLLKKQKYNDKIIEIYEQLLEIRS